MSKYSYKVYKDGSCSVWIKDQFLAVFKSLDYAKEVMEQD